MDRTFKFDTNPVYVYADDHTWISFIDLDGNFIDFSYLGNSQYYVDPNYIGQTIVSREEPYMVTYSNNTNAYISNLEKLIKKRVGYVEQENLNPVINGYQTIQGSLFISDTLGDNLTAEIVKNSSQIFNAGIWIPVYADYVYTTNLDLNLLVENRLIGKTLVNSSFYRFDNLKRSSVLCIM